MKRGRPKTSQDVPCVCQMCGKPFIVPDYVARLGAKFCSRACYLKPGPHRKRRPIEPGVRVCPICQTTFEVGGRGRPRTRQTWCSRECSVKDKLARGLYQGGSKQGHHYGWRNAMLDATEHPTTRDIIWTAGFYEGEGSCAATGGSHHVHIGQKNLWPLQRMQRWYGGALSQRLSARAPDMHEWNIHGARARGFLLTIFALLSPRRREQIKAALAR